MIADYQDLRYKKWEKVILYIQRETEGEVMRIKFVRKVKGEEMVREFEKKHGSLENLERYIEENKEDYIALMDYEDWQHFIENPAVVVEEGEIMVTDAAFLNDDLEELEAAGLIEFEVTDKEKKAELRCNEIVITI